VTAAGPDFSGQQDDIRRRVSQLQEALVALRKGGVDAIVLTDADGLGAPEVHPIGGTDRPYRTIVECMGEGAVTVAGDGSVVFANRQVAALLEVEAGDMIGRDVSAFVGAAHQPVLEELLATPPGEIRRAELGLTTRPGGEVPSLVAATSIDVGDGELRCLVVTDLTVQKEMEQELAIESARAEQRSERQRVAHEVNDTIVQGLVTAEMALDLGQVDRAREIVALVSDHARQWIGELAGGEEIAPGAAVRSAPATITGSAR
jgi:PAS domain S-box-containing protein